MLNDSNGKSTNLPSMSSSMKKENNAYFLAREYIFERRFNAKSTMGIEESNILYLLIYMARLKSCFRIERSFIFLTL